MLEQVTSIANKRFAIPHIDTSKKLVILFLLGDVNRLVGSISVLCLFRFGVKCELHGLDDDRLENLIGHQMMAGSMILISLA